MPNICILTPDPDYPENWQPTATHYQSLLGDDVSFRTWNDAGDLSAYDVILPLIAWGYQREPDRWFKALADWEKTERPFANSIATLRWNTDKDYLFDLEAAGVKIVPTRETHSLCADNLEAARAAFGVDTLVIKPSISGGADGTYLIAPGSAVPFDVLEKEMLIQPLMSAIASEGEFSLFYFNGVFSHAILKKPAQGDFRVQEQFGGREAAVTPPEGAYALAIAAIAAAPSCPLYARVDMVRGDDGAFYLMELELIEPSLFFGFAADEGAAFASALNAIMK
jgi:hypothetical protein